MRMFDRMSNPQIRMHQKSLTPKVSIVVPIYKVDNYLTQCLNSIVTQTLDDLEIILLDEGDLDRCREIIDSYAKNDPRIIAVHEKNGGYGISMNKGMQIATGEYIGFVESDDFIAPTMYEELYNYAKQLDVDFVKGPYFSWIDSADIFANARGKKQLMPYADYIASNVPRGMGYDIWTYPAQLCAHPSIWTGIYRTDFLREHNLEFIEKGAYVDVVFRMKAYMAAKKIAWYNKPFYYWRITNPTSTNAVWDLATAIKRTQQIHDLYRGEEPLFEKVAPFLIHEEYLNVYMRVKTDSCTKEQLQQMYALLNDYSSDIIKNSPVLNESERNYLLKFKQHEIGLSAYSIRKIKWKLYNITRSSIRYVPTLLQYSMAAILFALLFWLGIGGMNIVSIFLVSSAAVVFLLAVVVGAMFLGLKFLNIPT